VTECITYVYTHMLWHCYDAKHMLTSQHHHHHHHHHHHNDDNNNVYAGVVPATTFGRIIPSGSMLLDHALVAYVAALDGGERLLLLL